jgi:hydrogenase maturation protein HypF
MMPSLSSVEKHCRLNQAEKDLLTSRQRPIVLLKQRADSPLAEGIAPEQDQLGVMLPYTPLHYLLFASDAGQESPPAYDALVMTSGNISGEPIVTRNEEARDKISRLVDGYLLHNRAIHVHCDDAVTRVVEDDPYPIRRSRGYAPYPLTLPETGPSLLAAGGELKNTFCLTKDRYAFLSQHIGDLKNYETLRSYEESVAHFQHLFRVNPEAVAYDAHPDYLSSRYARDFAQREGLPEISVQHHHAHIASCLADNHHPEERPVIGVALDGTGFGDDRAIWGGEFFIADYQGYHRAYHLDYFPLPGGDQAIREPWRIALAALYAFNLDWEPDLPPVQHARHRPFAQARVDPLETLQHQLDHQVNTVPTSSMGRLFDAVSALLGIRQEITYEAQAAIELEALADPEEDAWYNFQADGNGISPAPLLQALLEDRKKDRSIARIAARFHNSLAKMVVETCQVLREQYDLNEVALSGGVWQNLTLLEKTLPQLRQADFIVYTHKDVPANDGGLALGQAVIAHQFLRSSNGA